MAFSQTQFLKLFWKDFRFR